MKFLQIVSCCFNENKNLPELDSAELKAVFELSASHNILPLVFKKMSEKYSENTVLKSYKKAALSLSMLQLLRTERFLSLYRILSSRGVRAVCVKGITLRTLYSDGECRPSTDEDLLIESEQLNLFCVLMREQGFIQRKRTDTEASFIDEKTSLVVEANTALFSVGGKPGEVLERLFKNSFENTATVNIGNTEILTLSPQMNILYLVCHAFKHFIHSGFGIRQVCDIAVFLEKYKNEIDLDALKKSLSELSAANFFEALVNISAKELGFENLWSLCKVKTSDETDLIEDILRAGVYGRGETSRAHSASITLSAAENQKSSPARVRLVFPKVEVLAAKYPVLNRTPALYPFCAASRLLKYIGEVVLCKNGSGTPTQSIEIANRRLKLMKRLGIIPPDGKKGGSVH